MTDFPVSIDRYIHTLKITTKIVKSSSTFWFETHESIVIVRRAFHVLKMNANSLKRRQTPFPWVETVSLCSRFSES